VGSINSGKKKKEKGNSKVGRGKQMIRTEEKWVWARCNVCPCSIEILTNRRRK